MPFKRLWRVTGARFSEGHKGSRERHARESGVNPRPWEPSPPQRPVALPQAIPKLHGVRRSAVASIKAEADRHAANVLPIIREAQKAGATTLRQIAEALNARGVATARGGQWYATSVSNVLNRA
jgi:hypothetical protein